jgi:integral membrane protein (TIGR01906 family)
MKFLILLAKILVIILVPIFFLMTSIRILITPIYPQVEYRMPGFPADPFGFSAQERLAFAKTSVAYLLNSEPISFLGNLKMADGSPLYNDRELSHMLDVKNLVQAMIKAWYFILFILLLIWLFAWRTGWLRGFFNAVRNGGWASLGLIGLIILSTFLDFSALFTGFHRIFFTGDTWLFYTSDSLIRLFPERFWSDAFLYIGILTIIFALIAIFGGRVLAKRFSSK